MNLLRGGVCVGQHVLQLLKTGQLGMQLLGVTTPTAMYLHICPAQEHEGVYTRVCM